MFARFFIDRPIFAWVLSIVIILGGGAAYFMLPIAQYPEITPPTVEVRCTYPGASAVVVADTVAAPIEQQVNGVERMLYMSSQSTNDGTYILTVTFQLGTDLDMAQVLVQNRVNLALPTLPDVVKATGVTVKKRSPSILLVVNLFSDIDPATNEPYRDQLFLSNYATIQVKDQLARIDGVGDISFLGQQDYSMRVWLDPDKLAARNVSSGDVAAVLREQNIQVAAGQIGQQPVPRGQDYQLTMTTLGRLRDKDEFANIVLKTGNDGQVTRLKDVGRVVLGARNEDTRCRLDGKPSVGLAIFQLPGSNALQVADRVKDKMKELKVDFPKNLEYAIVYDTTPFIDESIHEVYKTLIEAVILVAIVVLLFLQDWKTLMLPLIDVTVSLVGTLAIMAVVTMVGNATGISALVFSLNNLTLFGLVLAIGIVVDDAIVVLENIERWLATGLNVRDATIKAMDEITGPIIGITLVLCSVFLPSAFLGGISGQFYRQFALTIAASMVLSAINAMTLTPARATAIFGNRPPGAHHDDSSPVLPTWVIMGVFGLLAVKFLEGLAGSLIGLEELQKADAARAQMLTWAVRGVLFLVGAFVGWLVKKPLNHLLRRFFKAFNVVFEKVTAVYGRWVGRLLRISTIVLLVYGGLIGLTYFGFMKIPTGFIPEQDKGYLVVNIQLPDAASLERTEEVVARVEKIALETPGVVHTVSIPGMSIVLNSAVSSNFATMFITLDEFHKRHGAEFYSAHIADVVRRRCQKEIMEAQVAVFGPPPVDGLGSTGGFKLMVEDRSSLGLEVLQGQADNLAEQGNRQPGLVGLFNGFRADTPQLYVDIDRVKAKTMGLALSDVFDALQIYMGGYYVNDFNMSGRTWQVNIQADAPFRITPNELRQMKVRNNKNEMVPLGSVATVRDSSGPVMVTRYNMYPAAAINGGALPGVSSGTVIATMDRLADKELAKGMRTEWTELTYLETLAGGAAIFAFIGAVVLVFLVLSAQYESWSMPLAVIMVVPMCLLSALIGIFIARMDINIFVQVGFIVLVGLASKNAILIVEFAREREREGKSLYDATVEACTTRLRPIIMTSFAFVLGVLPLVLAEGAGAEMRRTLGTAVFAGMLGVTFFGIFLTPVFYYVIRGWVARPQPAAPLPAIKPAADGASTAITATPTHP